MSDMTSTDLGQTDMAPFFRRYDQRYRLVLVAALAASLVMSAFVLAHGPLAAGSAPPQVAATAWWFGLLFGPAVIVGWWTFGELMALGRRKARLPDGREPAGADDARNGLRIARAGFTFTLALMATVVTQQALMVTFLFGYRISAGEWIARATMILVGAVTIYLGNVYPRLPVPRALEQKAAIRMKANRVSGWMMVISGLLVVLLGLFLPLVVHHRP
jgi:hypothetical protein